MKKVGLKEEINISEIKDMRWPTTAFIGHGCLISAPKSEQLKLSNKQKMIFMISNITTALNRFSTNLMRNNFQRIVDGKTLKLSAGKKITCLID